MTDPTSVALSWDEDMDAWVEAQHSIRRRRIRRSPGVLWGCAICVVGLVVGVSVPAAAVLCMGLGLVLWVYVQRWWIRRTVGGRLEDLPLGRWTWHLSEDAIRCHQTSIRWVVPWTSIQRIESTPLVCLFWLSSGEALHMPRGAVTRDVQALLSRWHSRPVPWTPPPPHLDAPWVLQFERSVDDAVNLTLGAQPQLSGLRKLWRIGLAVFVGGLGLVQLWVDLQGSPSLADGARSIVMLGLSALLLMRFTPASRVFWTVVIRWITRRERGAGILGPTAYTLDTEGIHLIRGVGESRLAWSKIHSIQAVSGGALVRPVWGTPLWIPQRAFSDANAQHRCVDQVGSWIRQAHIQKGIEHSSLPLDRSNPFAPPVD